MKSTIQLEMVYFCIAVPFYAPAKAPPRELIMHLVFFGTIDIGSERSFRAQVMESLLSEG